MLNSRFLNWLLSATLLLSFPLYGKENSPSDNQEQKSDNEDEEKSSGKEDEDKGGGKGDAKDKAAEENEEAEPPKIGNFSLPTSQQPAALFGFGGNIIDKGEVQLYFFADNFRGRQKTVCDLIPSVLFGITKELSIFFNFPFTPDMRDGPFRSSGLEDFFVQLEYAFYNKSTDIYQDQATVLANISVPTGSSLRNPPTGFGAPTFFIGATYYHTEVDWLVFVAPGVYLTTSDRGTKFGDQFLYQFGLEGYIPSPCGWIYAWLIEVDGQYNKKNRINGIIDDNSGGNVIYVTPSGWISTKEMLFQFGVSLPVAQHLYGSQHKFKYALNFNFAWSFY